MAFEEDIERILDGSIDNIDKKRLYAELITESMLKDSREYLKTKVAHIISRIYDGDIERLEADIVKLKIFNSDECKIDDKKLRTLNEMLPTITEYYTDIDEFLERVKR